MHSRRLLSVALVAASISIAGVAEAQDCVPSCRDGYVCHQGQCISACNPACAAGERCVGDGQCVAEAPASEADAPEPVIGPVVATPLTATVAPVAAQAPPPPPGRALPMAFTIGGGALLLGGIAVFAAVPWEPCGDLSYYEEECEWSGGQYGGVAMMIVGLISLGVSLPFTIIRSVQMKDWQRKYAERPRVLALRPSYALTPEGGQYRLSLVGSF